MKIQTFDQARQFLARVVPWEAGAYVNIHFPFTPEGRDKPMFPGHAFSSVDEAVNGVQFLLSKNQRDIYVCMSSQRVSEDPKPGKAWRKAVRGQDNAVALKALFLDIDIKVDNPDCYGSMGEAIIGLRNFLGSTDMPEPSVYVASGGGVHVYWVLDQPITPDQWRPLACAFLNAAKTHGLKVDEKVTTDSARLLRVPDTFNCKLSTLRPVRLAGKSGPDYHIDVIRAALLPYAVTVPTARSGGLDANIFPRLAPIQDASELSGGVDTVMAQPQIRACLDAIPNTKTDWNFWNNVGMRIFSAVNGADYGLDEWHRWSTTHVVAGATDTCQSRWDTFKVSPPTRTGAGALVNQARDATGNPGWLPYKPVTGFSTVPATPLGASSGATNADLPPKYHRTHDGLIEKIVEGTDGTQELVQVSHKPMTDAFIEDASPSQLLHFTTDFHGKPRRITLPTDAVGFPTMRQIIQAQGFTVYKRETDRLWEFMVAWLDKLQASKDGVVTTAPFGWSDKFGMLEGFVYNNILWKPNGTASAPNPDPVMSAQYTPSGIMQPWRDACNFMTDQGRPALDAVIASSFGAPLVRFTGMEGLLMSTWSQESGVGKTSVLAVAQAVWGSSKASQGLTDTINSADKKIGQLRSLPLYWDELKSREQIKKFVEYVFQVTSGRGKNRLNRAAQTVLAGTWQTLVVSASNESLLDPIMQHTIGTTAGLYRVFEYEVPWAAKSASSSDVSRMTDQLKTNFGWAGLEYATFLGNNFELIYGEMGDFNRALEAEVSAIADERMWVALIACLLMGAKYANQLKLTNINEPKLKEFLLDTLTRMRGERVLTANDLKERDNIANRIQEFLSEMRGQHTIFTNKVPLSAGRPPAGIKSLSDFTRVNGCYVHYAIDQTILRFSSTAFTDFCKRKGYSRHQLTQELIRQYTANPNARVKLGAGTPKAQGQEIAYEINYQGHPELDPEIT